MYSLYNLYFIANYCTYEYIKNRVKAKCESPNESPCESPNLKLISLSKYVRYLVLFLSDDPFIHPSGVVYSFSAVHPVCLSDSKRELAQYNIN